MKSLLRAVQCTESLQKRCILDRKLPSKVSMLCKDGCGYDHIFILLARGFCLVSNYQLGISVWQLKGAE